jgi:hypothetical protein
MQRLFKAMICAFIACALCGCASVDDSGRRAAQGPAAPAETKASSQHLSTPGTGAQGQAAVANTTSPAPSTGNLPIAEVPETTYTFGPADRSNLSHAFVVKNAGKSDLIIKKVLPG